MDRRAFIHRLAFGSLGTLPLWSPRGFVQAKQSAYAADAIVVGGGVGGFAAALALVRTGRRVVLTEETDWIGGQLTQQGVPPDEHPWIEQFGAPASYRRFRNLVRDYYRGAYSLSSSAMQADQLNPGNCGVSVICHEPRVALAVLESMIAPYMSNGQLTVLLDVDPVQAEVDGDRIRAVQVRHRWSGDSTWLQAPFFLDATETGALLPLAGVEYVTGAESQEETGELHAPSEAQPDNMQAVTWCFAIEYCPGEEHIIDPPADYDFWRNYIPEMRPPWSGPLLSLSYSNPITLEPRTLDFDPRPGAVTERFNLWAYRRLIDPANFADGNYTGGISLINWPQNDYWLGNLFEVAPDEQRKHEAGAMSVSYALLHWLQTEAPRPDGGLGWPGLKLRGDLMGTAHGLAKRPYIREARRIQAEFTVKEQHVGLDARMAETGLPQGEVRAASFEDSVGVGSYRIDLHPSTGGDNYIDVSSLPFEIPLGSLIPIRVENLLAAGKNMGSTHITNGCYRLHPVEWGVGEAAGLLTSYCLQRGLKPSAVRATPGELEQLNRLVDREGVQRKWPEPMTTPR